MTLDREAMRRDAKNVLDSYAHLGWRHQAENVLTLLDKVEEQQAEIERLRDALVDVQLSGLLNGSYQLHVNIRKTVAAALQQQEPKP